MARLNRCAVQADADSLRRTYAAIGQQQRVGQRPAAQRAGRDLSGGKSPLAGRFNITHRYANRRAVTALARRWGHGVRAGKRRASPALRVTSRYVFAPGKARSSNRACGCVCCAHPPTAMLVRAAARRAGSVKLPALRVGRLASLRPVPRHALVRVLRTPTPPARLSVRRAGRLNRCAVQAEPASASRRAQASSKGNSQSGFGEGARGCSLLSSQASAVLGASRPSPTGGAARQP